MSGSPPSPGEAEDRALVARCLSGERIAWDELAARHASLLATEVRFSLRRFGLPEHPGAVDDLLQEVFVALLERDRAALRNFRWRSSLRSYLCAVAATRAAHVLSRRPDRRRPDPEALALRLRSELPLPDETAEADAALERALSRLPAKERLVLRLHYWDELPAAGIARLLSVQPGSVHVFLSRARQRLRELIQRPLCL